MKGTKITKIYQNSHIFALLSPTWIMFWNLKWVLNVNNNIFKVGTTAYLTMRTYTYIYKSNITIVLKIYETCSNVE